MNLESRTSSRRASIMALLMVVLMLLSLYPSTVVADGVGTDPPHKIDDSTVVDTLMGAAPAEDPYGLDILTTVLETLLLIP